MPPEAKAVEPIIPFSPMPGGALTANTQMMRDIGMLDKYPEVIKEMREVVLRGGFGSSVTPVSQFYFQQAFTNVINGRDSSGEWNKVFDSYGRMVLGYFGKTPVPPDPKVVDLASKQLDMDPTTRNPREINDEDPNKGIEAATKKLQEHNLPITDENIFIAASLKEKGIAFLKGDFTIGVRKNSPSQEKEAPAKKAATHYTVQVADKTFAVEFRNGTAIVNGKPYDYNVAATDQTGGPATAPTKANVEVKGKAEVTKLQSKSNSCKV